MRTVLLEQSRFNKLCDDYFPADSSFDARKAFDDLVAVAQALNEAVVAHQKTLVDKARVEAYLPRSGLPERRSWATQPRCSGLRSKYSSAVR